MPTRRGFKEDSGIWNALADHYSHVIGGGYDWHRVRRRKTAIFALSQLALASPLPLDFMNVTRALLIVWIIGRFLFVIGYSRHPFLRTFGMSPTLLPPILAMGYAAWQILVG